MSEAELIYFGIHGRVFVARTLFELSGKPFKDTKVTFEEFAKMKPGKLFFNSQINLNHLSRINHYFRSSTWTVADTQSRWRGFLSEYRDCTLRRVPV